MLHCVSTVFDVLFWSKEMAYLYYIIGPALLCAADTVSLYQCVINSGVLASTYHPIAS